ncbi:host attachment protein [Thermaurantiacus sp.]
MRIPHGAQVMVVDGGRMGLFRNKGREFEPELELLEQEQAEWPKTSDLGADRPGRAFESSGSRRSAYEVTDIHDKAEEQFVTAAAKRLEAMLGDPKAKVLLVAAPKALGIMRKALSDDVRSRLVGEVAKAYGGKTAGELSDLLAKLDA